jgi:uncharacterized protein YyaL (SSP411 family)
MPNVLAREKSLYLRQHANNPVHWYPWGPEAFSEARRRDVPVIISIGYSSCHWCHVMARECFEDDYIARLMNEHFVCIKVDREERPDVDKMCMDAVQMILQRGGWPLNVFCLPDGRPFFGGTYFPAVDRGQGLIPWPQLLMRVSEHYQGKREELVQNAEAIVENLFFANNVEGAAEGAIDENVLLDAARTICAMHDDTEGGLGGAPKFPYPMSLAFLGSLRKAAQTKAPDLGARIDVVLVKTLDAMTNGALFDQVGGGFFRYCVDARWQTPHFEKMLYDNGLLLETFATGYLRYGKPRYKSACEALVDWLLREMSDAAGGFYTALDADTDHHEGATYVWTPGQILEALGNEADAQAFCDAYAITQQGTFEHGASIPTFRSGDAALQEKLAPLVRKLLAARNQRPQPGKDTKIITGWNALIIRGLARAGWALGRKDWVRRAIQCSDFLWQHARQPNGQLKAVCYGTEAAHPGTLNDYAWLAEAELALSAMADWADSGNIHAGERHRERATRITEAILARFADVSGNPGFFLNDADSDDLPVRQKDWWDNATPSGNAALVHVFSTLSALDGEPRWLEQLQSLKKNYAPLARQSPNGIAHALTGFVRAQEPVAILKIKTDSTVWDKLRETLDKHAFDIATGKLIPMRNDSIDQPVGFQLCAGQTCRLVSPDF